MTKREKDFLDSMLALHALCEMIKIEYYLSVKDTGFKNPRIASKADKIAEFANSITDKELRGLITFAHRDEFEDSHVLYLHEIFKELLLQPTEILKGFAEYLSKKEIKE